MHFDEKFAVSKRPQWFNKYLDLSCISELTGFEFSISLEENSPFFSKLEEEVDRFTSFYVNTLVSLEEMRLNLKEEKKSLRKWHSEDLHVYLETLIKLAHESMEICLFIVLNLQATRVLIKRYESHIFKYQKRARDIIQNRLHNINKKFSNALSENILQKILDDLQNIHYTKCKRLIEGKSQESLLGASLKDKLEVLDLTIDDFKNQHYKLKNNKPLAVYLYHQVGNDIEGPVIIEPRSSPMKNLVLILVLVFLYSSNACMLCITSKYYLKELDYPESYVGLLNACTPMASLVFGMITGIWTRYSYKLPIGTAALWILVGNITNGLALHFELGSLLFLGRLLLGIGGSGLISKMYMAEHISNENRARWSAGLVLVIAIGMASGPLLAVFFDIINFSVLSYGEQIFSTIIWTCVMVIYLVIFLFVFEDTSQEIIINRFNNSNHWNHSYWAVGLCAWTLVIASMIQEGFISSAPITKFPFFKDNELSFNYLGILISSLCLIPMISHCFIGVLTVKFSEREFLFISGIAVIVGSGLFLDFGDISEFQFTLSSIILFLATDVADGVSNSLISIKLPKKISKGLADSGFLSTQAVLFGKIIGDLVVWGISSNDIRRLELYQGIVWCSLGILTLILIYLLYRHLDSSRKDK